MKILSEECKLRRISEMKILLDTVNYKGALLENCVIEGESDLEYTGVCLDMSFLNKQFVDVLDFTKWCIQETDHSRYCVLTIEEVEQFLLLKVEGIYCSSRPKCLDNTPQLKFIPTKEIFVMQCTRSIPTVSEKEFRTFCFDISGTEYKVELAFAPGKCLWVKILDEDYNIKDNVKIDISQSHFGWHYKIVSNGESSNSTDNSKLHSIELWVTVAKTDALAAKELPGFGVMDTFEHYLIRCDVDPEAEEVLQLKYTEYTDFEYEMYKNQSK